MTPSHIYHLVAAALQNPASQVIMRHATEPRPNSADLYVTSTLTIIHELEQWDNVPITHELPVGHIRRMFANPDHRPD